MNFSELNLKAAEEGCVLLRNENQTLPLLKDDKVSIFGRAAFDFLYSGLGSGGSVHVPYRTILADELVNLSQLKKGPEISENLISIYNEWRKENPFDTGGGVWAGEPWSQKEMPVSKELAIEESKTSNKAIYVISRNAGEDKDLAIQKGSWYLSQDEETVLENICAAFEKVCVVFNTCGIMDTSFINDKKFKNHIAAAIYVWQGGMEAGKAAANVLTANAIPCGKLSDTIALDINDYPSTKNFGQKDKVFYQEDIFVGYRYFLTFAKQKILFPFGFGMSYTDFLTEILEAAFDSKKVKVRAKITNIGKLYAGKETLQLYLQCPQGKLGKPEKVLASYKKTPLLETGKSCVLELEFNLEDFASYDDSGATGNEFCWILEKGKYFVFAGNDSLSAKKIDLNIELSEDKIIEKLEQSAAPTQCFKRMKSVCKENDEENFELSFEDVPLNKVDLQKRIHENLPPEIKFCGSKKITFDDVKKDNSLLDDFVAQLNAKELSTIVRGEGMMSAKVTMGVTSAFGGLSESLHNYKIPVACTADGPSGIRIDTGKEANLMPTGTCLACTWNEDLIESLYFAEGEELLKNQIDTLLGPGMNIHRNPLNGRNFEYFSEDPLLTAKMASAEMKALHNAGSNGTCKHFACNSQEICRNSSDSIISERALREIYLKAFEIAVKTGAVHSLMTSYNGINGHWAASNYDLVNTILRKQWGYKGLVMTDWWAKMNNCVTGGNPTIKNAAYMVKARNDVYMIVDNDGAEKNLYGDNIEECLKNGELTIGELQLCTKDILNFILESPVSKRELRPLKVILTFEPKISQEDLNSDAKIIKEGEEFIPEANTYFYAEEETTFNVSGTYIKKADDLSQSVTNIFIDGKAAASLECRSTAGESTTVNATQIILKKGFYKITMENTKPGIELEKLNFNSKILTPVSMGIIK